MEKFDSPTVKGDGMGIHNSRSVLFESEAQAFVEVLTDFVVRVSGAWYDCIGVFVMNTLPLREGHNGEDIVVPFDDVVMVVVSKLWEVGGGGSFYLPSVDLLSKGVVCNICTSSRLRLE